MASSGKKRLRRKEEYKYLPAGKRRHFLAVMSVVLISLAVFTTVFQSSFDISPLTGAATRPVSTTITFTQRPSKVEGTFCNTNRPTNLVKGDTSRLFLEHPQPLFKTKSAVVLDATLCVESSSFFSLTKNCIASEMPSTFASGLRRKVYCGVEKLGEDGWCGYFSDGKKMYCALFLPEQSK